MYDTCSFSAPLSIWMKPEYTGNVEGLIPWGGLTVTSNFVVLPGFSLKLDFENLTVEYWFLSGTGPMFDWMEF